MLLKCKYVRKKIDSRIKQKKKKVSRFFGEIEKIVALNPHRSIYRTKEKKIKRKPKRKKKPDKCN